MRIQFSSQENAALVRYALTQEGVARRGVMVISGGV
jgi:hypothetical protein